VGGWSGLARVKSVVRSTTGVEQACLIVIETIVSSWGILLSLEPIVLMIEALLGCNQPILFFSHTKPAPPASQPTILSRTECEKKRKKMFRSKKKYLGINNMVCASKTLLL